MQTTQENKHTILTYLFYGLALVAILGVIVYLFISSTLSVDVSTGEAPQALGMIRGEPLASMATGEAVEEQKQFLLTTDEDGNMQHSGMTIHTLPNTATQVLGSVLGVERDDEESTTSIRLYNPTEGREWTLQSRADQLRIMEKGGNGETKGLTVENTKLTVHGEASIATKMTIGEQLCIGDVCIQKEHLLALKGEKDLNIQHVPSNNAWRLKTT